MRRSSQWRARTGQREFSAGPARALAELGISPNKLRGQNFLVQKTVASRIVELAELSADDTVVEIGPGLGILSEQIVKSSARRVCLVELDLVLAERLKARLRDVPKVEVVRADFLELSFRDLAELLDLPDLKDLKERPPLKILGNLPFNVAAAILRKLCDYDQMITLMVLMFQREVAQRIRAVPGDPDYGALSVYSALYWSIGTHFRVEGGSFYPRPKVDAEVLRFIPRPVPVCEPTLRPMVIEVIRAGFSTRRKTMRNALSSGLEISRESSEAILSHAALDPGARAESLGLSEFVCIARAIASRADLTWDLAKPGTGGA